MSNIKDLWKRELVWTQFDIQPNYSAWKQEVKEIYNDTFVLDSHFLMFNWSKYQSGVTFRYIHENDDIYKQDLVVSDSKNYLTNYFSPYDIINNFYNNIHPVDIACDFNVFLSNNYYKLDGVKLNPGNRILLFGNNNKRQNGIYVVNSKYFLNRTNELSNSEKTFRYQVYCKSGTYANKHFYLPHDENGKFPQDGDLITFNQDRGVILKNTVNYDIYSTGNTHSSKIIFTDIDVARKQLTVNSDFYGRIQLSGTSIVDIVPLTMIYKDITYPIERSASIDYTSKYYNNGFNIYNYEGETHIKLGTTSMPYNVNDYIDIKVYFNDIDNPFIDNNYFHIKSFIKEVKGNIIVITDIIPNYVLNIIEANFDGYYINILSGGTTLDSETIYEDEFLNNLGWNLTNFFKISNEYLKMEITGSTSGITSTASQNLWENINSGETYKFTFKIIENDFNNPYTGSTYISGSTGFQKLFDFYPQYTGVTTYSYLFTSTNDYTDLFIEFNSTNINEISFDYIKLEKIKNTYNLDSGLTLYYDMENLDIIKTATTLFFEEDFSDVIISTGTTSGDTSGSTWNLDEYVIISGETLKVLSGSTDNQHANTYIGSIFEENINLKFDCNYSGNTLSSVYLMGSSYIQKITDFSGNTNLTNIDINGNVNYIIFTFPSGITGVTIDNIEINLNYQIFYPDTIEDNINNIISTGHTLSLNDEGIYNNSFTYNGINSYMELPINTISSGNTKSISLWFKTNKQGVILGYQNSIVENYTTIYCPMIYVGFDGKLRCQAYNNSIKPITSGKKVNDNNWHNIILILENNTQKAYLDSEIIGKISNTINHNFLIYNQLGVGFGGNWEQTNKDWFYFEGEIDEFGHWNKILSKFEIDYIYNNGKGSTYYIDTPELISDIDKYSYTIRNLNYTNLLLINFTSTIDESYLNDFIKTDIELLGTNSAVTDNNLLTFLDDKYGKPIDYFNFDKSGDFGDSFGDFGYSGYASWDNNNIVFTGITTGISYGEYYSNSFVVSKGERFLFNSFISGLTIDGYNLLTPEFESDLNILTGYTVKILSGYTDLNLYEGDPNWELVSYYDFDSINNQVWKQSIDYSGSTINYTGQTLSNTAITIDNGLYGYSYKFDGFESKTEFDFYIQNPMSISLWFKTDTTGILLGQQDKQAPNIPDNFIPLIYIGIDGKLRCGFGKSLEHIEASSVVDNIWHNVVLILNGNTQKLYLDGKFINSGITTLTTGLTYTQLGTGYGNGYDNIISINYFNYKGLIDEFSVFNKNLNENNILEIYNNKFGSTFDTEKESLTYFISNFNSSQNTTKTIKSSTFNVEKDFWYKLEFNIYDVENISNLSIYLVDNSGNTNSIIIDEDGNYISDKYDNNLLNLLENRNSEIIFKALKSEISYIKFDITPFDVTNIKKFNAYMKFYLFDNIKLIVNIRDKNKIPISNNIIIDDLGFKSEILKITEDIDISVQEAFLFTIFDPNGTPTSTKIANGYFELYRIEEDFRLYIEPKYSSENRYFYYDEFALLVEGSNYILTQNEFPILYPNLTDGALILTEDSLTGETEKPLTKEQDIILDEEKKKFNVFNDYINYNLYSFLNGVCSGITEDYKIYKNNEIIYNDSYDWEFYDSSESMIKIIPFNSNQLNYFIPYTYIKYDGDVYALILEVEDNYMIIEKGYNFDSMPSGDSSFRNVTTIKDISDILNDNYIGYSYFINVQDRETSKKISDTYGKIISEDEKIQKCTTGIIYGDKDNKYIFKIFNKNDEKLEYNPVEISVIGVDKKYRFPITLENDNFKQ